MEEEEKELRFSLGGTLENVVDLVQRKRWLTISGVESEESEFLFYYVMLLNLTYFIILFLYKKQFACMLSPGVESEESEFLFYYVMLLNLTYFIILFLYKKQFACMSV